MNQMKKFVLCALLYIAVAGMVSSVSAATLRFDPTSFTGAEGDTFDVDVLVSPGSDQISAVDVYVNFDSSIVSATDVQTTDLFDNINQSVDTNQVYLNGIFTSGDKYIDEEGILATITFQLNSANPGTLQFYCDKTRNNSSKIVKNDVNATNVIECENLTLFSISGGTTAPGGSSSGPTPTTLPASGTSQQQQQQQQQQQAQGVVYLQGQLPQSGIFENVLKYSIPGALMLVVGVVIKFFI
jgi:hypothetical protein